MPLVLVTGVTGFIATHVVKQLLEGGYKVRGSVRDPSDKKKHEHLFKLTKNAASDLTLVQGDLNDAKCWEEAVKGCDLVCHVASPFPGANPKNEDELIIPAREGTLNVLKAVAKEKSVKRVVLTSSLAAICEGGGNPKTLDEKDWANPANLSEMSYNKSKVIAEKAAWDFHAGLKADGRFELVSVNPVIVFGPVLHASASTSVGLVKMLLEGAFPVVPPLIFPLVDVRDVATAQVKCLTSKEANNHRHLLVSYDLWYKEIADILAKEFAPQGYNVPTNEMPEEVLKQAAQGDPTMKYMYDFNGKPMLLNNARFTKVLQIKPIDKVKTVIDTAYSLIESGAVKKSDKYTGPKK